MKPTKLIIKGLNSIEQEQCIDFERLYQSGLFGIFGPTGSGKSTILDGITFALYGRIARNIGSRSLLSYINANSDKIAVTLEFEVSTFKKKYRVYREIKRKNSNTGTETSRIKISDITNEEQLLAEDQSGVEEELDKIVGLGYEDFIKTVVLPQGGFNDFLKMSGKERSEVLERLFNLEKYGVKLVAAIKRRDSQLKEKMNHIEGQLNTYQEATPENIRAMEEQLEQLLNEKKDLFHAWDQIKKDNGKLREIYQWQKEMQMVTKEIENLENQSAKIILLEEQLENHHKSVPLMPQILSYEELVRAGKALKSRETIEKAELDSLTQKKVEVKKRYEEIEEQNNHHVPLWIAEKTRLGSGLDQWNKHNEYKRQIEKLIPEIQFGDGAEKDLRESLNYSQGILKELEEGINAKKIGIEHLEKTEGYKNNIRLGEKYDRKIQELRFEIEKLRKEKEELQEGAKRIHEHRNQLLEAIKNEEAELNEIDSQLIIAKNNPLYEVDYYLKERENKRQRIEQRKELAILQSAMKQKQEQITNNQQKLENNKRACDELSLQMDEINKRYEQEMIHHGILLIQENLKEGDACPVCHQRIHSVERLVHAKEENHLVKLQENIQKMKEQWEELTKSKGALDECRDSYDKEWKIIQMQIEPYIHLQELSIETFEREEQQLISDFETLQKDKDKLVEEHKQWNSSIEQKNNDLKILAHKMETSEQGILEKKKSIQEKSEQQGDAIELLKKLGLPEGISPKELYEQLQRDEEQLEVLRNELQNKERAVQKQRELIETEKNKLHLLENENIQRKISCENLKKEVEIEGDSLKKLLGEVVNPSSKIDEIGRKILWVQEVYQDTKKEKEGIDSQFEKMNSQYQATYSKLIDLRSNAKNVQENLIQNMDKLQGTALGNVEKNGKQGMLHKEIDRIKGQYLESEAIKELNTMITQYHRELSEKKGQKKGLAQKIGDWRIEEEQYKIQMAKEEQLEKSHKELEEKTIQKKTQLDAQVEMQKLAEKLYKEKKELNTEIARLKEINSVTSGKKFVQFMAIKQLSYVSKAATLQLMKITNGAYHLEVDDEGNFKIRDNKNGGVLRDVKTLSGGETFVVSLALALALSAQIQLKGTAPLELFFLDEGFGTLDEDLLDTVIDSLERIHNDRLKIGIISHVEQLKQRIPVKLLVEPAKSGSGGSKVRLEYS